MDEFSFIQSIQPKNYKQSNLIKGIGDDAAVFRPAYQDVVTSVDTFVEGVHFSKETMSAHDVGYRVLASNISDMAAMGCKPAFYLVSIVIPNHWTMEELQSLYKGMESLAQHYHMDLIGGDTVSGEQLVISITIIGKVSKDKARYRSHAESGDVVFVTGTLGDSAVGLHLLLQQDKGQDNTYFIQRHRKPSPRVEFATYLEPLQRLSLNDVSDGISSDAAEIAESSNVDIHIDYEAIPIQSKLTTRFDASLIRKWVLSGGEDYELIGTVPASDWDFVMEAARQSKTEVTKVGIVKQVKGTGPVVYLHEAGKTQVLKKEGFNHLKGDET
ncbi:thiamine-phosphate kinase [Radiobacillus kanasensis]|uniref:thiamine-phosphate kinase n=1 Tax=Radiobacillus kanasensis TaxID=2844358 RepID=UPI001E2FBBF8|nr:thiamine-phosphate kinase [Radiobacillus kanasensis]UFT99833.1 thiamine-phosphate kinase [Radiobacillus kanasensis]